ncbi:hypothetical protein SNE40_014924 [Patella caerulea]|uniref:Uncharacterized protein n=1 Tax=Patella caerulea TaxID=87958 RepID=A0AAN8JEJ2_PATCE
MAAGENTCHGSDEFYKLSALYVIILLILLAGDIEANPGPPKRNAVQKEKGLERINDDSNVIDVLKDMWREIREMKSDIQQIGSLRSDVNKVIDDVSKAKEDTESIKKENRQLKKKIGELEDKIDVIENENKQNNIVINGLDIRVSDRQKEFEEKVSTLFKDKLKIREDIKVDKAFPNKDRSCMIVKLTNDRDKSLIISAAMALSDPAIYISSDYSYKVRQTRKKLIKHMIKARDNGHNAKLKFDKLLIDRKIYSLDELENGDYD